MRSAPLRAALAPLLALLFAAAPAAQQAPPAVPSEGLDAESVLDPEYAARLAPLAAGLERRLEELRLPGFALAIVAEDRVIFARGFGLADVEAGKPVTPGTLFAVGSTSKAFTATLVAMLVEEGRLGLDDPLTLFLPWFEPPLRSRADESLNVRDLLAHRTGFAHMDGLWYGTGASSEEILRTALGAEPIAAFRKEFHYNNVMYLAAGRTCEEVTGESWGALLQARFFEPLGMRDSSTSIAAAQADPRLALGYAWDGAARRFQRVPMRTLDAIAPAGAINSNVLDLTRWVRFQLGRGAIEGRRLVSAELHAETWKPHVQAAGDTRYGLGWFLRTWQGQPYVEHGGNIDGFAAEVALLPEAGIGLAFLCNVGATPLQGTIGPEVFAALLNDPASAAETPAGSELDLARYTGTYLANYFQFHDAKFEVVLKGDVLAIDIPGQTVFELLPPDASGKRAFKLVPKELQADFLEEDGQVLELRLYQNGMRFDMPRVGYEPEAELDPAELEPYLGRYADPLTGKTFEVVVSRNRLAADYPEQMVYELLPPENDERWVFRATDQMALEFELDADGRAEAVTFHERGTKRTCERVGGSEGALPTLEELLVLRRAAAFEARLAELGPCRIQGSMRFVYSGMQGPMTTDFDALGRSLEVVDLRPFLWTQSAFDGERVRLRSSHAAESELTGAHLDQTRANTPAALFGDWSRRFDAVAIERVDEERGARTLRVRLTRGGAPALVVHVDLVTGDLVRAELRDLVDGGSSSARTVTFEGWRELEGLRLPTRMLSEDPAAGRIVVEYASVERLPTGPDLFALPPALPAR